MTTAPAPRSGHPVTRAVAGVHAVLDRVAETGSLWSMDAAEAGAALVDLTVEIARLQELRLRVAARAQAADVGAEVGATSTANWWAHETRLTRPETHRLVRLAERLDAGRHEPVRAALAAGAVNLDQAQVVVDAVDDLPGDLVDEATRVQAEEFLVEQARLHDATALRRLGKRLVEVAAPDHADAVEAARLEREEAAARAAARLTMTDDGHGKTHGRFTIPTHHAAMLRTALLAIAAPSAGRVPPRGTVETPFAGRVPPRGTSGGVSRPPAPERLGQALCEYLERFPADRLPDAGGIAATIVVTMTLDSLLGGLKAAHLSTGETISATEARRLACGAGIIPAVLGGAGQPLDMGRTRRLHTKAQRIAMGLRDGGCTAEGCDWPPALCHAHHVVAWQHGGGTSVENGRLLCPRHHARAHDPAFETRALPNGKITFHRRC